VLLQVESLRVNYGHMEALHGLDIEVGTGEFVALLGPNGAGKTTLLRTLSGLQPVRGGRISYRGHDAVRLAPDKLVRLGLVQVMSGSSVFLRQTVAANLDLGAYVFRKQRTRVREDVVRVVELFPVLGRKLGDPASSLSGGERQMLAIGQALMTRPELLLLDEPSAGLAPQLVELVFSALETLKGEGLSCLLAEQAADYALAISSRAYVINAGEMVLRGTTEELQGRREIEEAYLGRFRRRNGGRGQHETSIR
jgi:branched-chain amino acid transport system ATP-binding protein